MYKVFLNEGKKKDAFKKVSVRFPEDKSLIKAAFDFDKTSSGKYIPWIEKNLTEYIEYLAPYGGLNQNQGQNLLELLGDGLDFFEKNYNKITPEVIGDLFDAWSVGEVYAFPNFDRVMKSPKDITSYTPKTLKYLKGVLTSRVSKKKQEQESKKEAEKIYDDGNVLVVRTKSHRASCYYGARTKWCTTMDRPDYWNQYTSKGNLYYVIDRSGKKEKVAVYVPKIGSVEVYNAQDIRKDTDFLYSKYPEVVDVFEEKIESSETLEALKNYKNNQISGNDLSDLDPIISSVRYRTPYTEDKDLMVDLSFNNENEFWDMFSNISEDDKMILNNMGSHYGWDFVDSGNFDYEWEEGYAFSWFTDEQKERLLKLLPMVNPSLTKCAANFEDDTCKEQTAKFLRTMYSREVNDIIMEYSSERNNEISQGIIEELNSEYSNMFSKYGLPMDLTNFYKAKVSVNDLISFYEKYDPRGKLNIYNLFKSVIEKESIQPPYNIYDLIYEVSVPGFEYNNTQRSIDNLLNDIEEKFEDMDEEKKDGYLDIFNLIQKLGGIDEWFTMPGDDRYKISIQTIDIEDGLVYFHVKSNEGKNRRGFKLPYEKFKDFVYNKQIFDIF